MLAKSTEVLTTGVFDSTLRIDYIEKYIIDSVNKAESLPVFFTTGYLSNTPLPLSKPPKGESWVRGK
jgi:hypothetical protein